MTRVALITGAARPLGLGQAIAARLAADGCDILLHDRGATEGDIAPAHGIGVVDDLETTAQTISSSSSVRNDCKSVVLPEPISPVMTTKPSASQIVDSI